MATIKSYTDLQQSRKLAEILPLESADGCWKGTTNLLAANTTFWLYTKYIKGKGIPAWSLAALLNIIPKHIKDYNVLRIDISENDTSIWYDEIGYGVNNDLPDITMEYTVDACYEMILKLHELNLL